MEKKGPKRQPKSKAPTISKIQEPFMPSNDLNLNETEIRKINE